VSTQAKKYTRAEANIEIAKRLWPNAEVELLPLSKQVNVLIYDKPNETRSWHGFDVFTDRDAAVKAVRALLAEGQVEAWDVFIGQFHGYNLDDQLKTSTRPYEKFFAAGLLAETKNIGRALCAAWGIELEGEVE